MANASVGACATSTELSSSSTLRPTSSAGETACSFGAEPLPQPHVSDASVLEPVFLQPTSNDAAAVSITPGAAVSASAETPTTLELPAAATVVNLQPTAAQWAPLIRKALKWRQNKIDRLLTPAIWERYLGSRTELVDAFMTAQGYDRHLEHVPGDGDCMWSAIAKGTGGAVTGDVLRAMIVTWMRWKPQYLLPGACACMCYELCNDIAAKATLCCQAGPFFCRSTCLLP